MNFYPHRHYVVAVILFAVVTLISQLLQTHLEMTNIILIHLLPVIVVALRGEYVATAIVTTFSVSVLALIYILPHLNFLMDEIIYIWSFIIFYIVGFTITFQAKRIQLITIKEILYHTLSHDLKTPLSSIMGNATLLQNDKMPLDTFHHTVLNQITESSQRMDRLISNLLDSARLQNRHSALKNEWCDLEDLLGVSLHEFGSIGIEDRLHCTLPSDLPLFYGDANLLVRLFVNLLDNAVKYSDPDKRIQITIIAEKKQIHLSFFNESAPLLASELHHIFDKFYRLHTASDISGSGIGLSICREIVRAHHGQIKAYNKENGICFDITLPVRKHPHIYTSENV